MFPHFRARFLQLTPEKNNIRVYQTLPHVTLYHFAKFRLGACDDSEVDDIYEEALVEAHLHELVGWSLFKTTRFKILGKIKVQTQSNHSCWKSSSSEIIENKTPQPTHPSTQVEGCRILRAQARAVASEIRKAQEDRKS